MTEAAQIDVLVDVFIHWIDASFRDFNAQRDTVNSLFSQNNRFCSGSHFKALSQAAATSALLFLAKARALPVDVDSVSTVRANVNALFGHFTADIRPGAIDPARRYAGCHESGVAERMIGEAKSQVLGRLDLWELEHRVAAANLPNRPQAQRVHRNAVDINAWIAECGEQNSKVAWSKFKAEHGLTAPKKTEFEDAWRAATGYRGRGRLLKTK